MMSGTLFVVGTPIGNLADLSPRALQTLERADVLYAEDTRHSATLLRHYGFRTPLRSLHEHNEAQRVEEVLGRLAGGENCALISDAGTPTVSDPGARLVAAAAEAGFRIEPVPGPSAVTTALAAAGLPARRFLFIGFAPRKGRERDEWLQQVVRSPDTVVAFEAPGRLAGLLELWVAEGAGERRCVVCRELTKLHEEVRHGTVSTLAAYYTDREVRGEITVVLEGRGGDVPGEPVDEEQALATAIELRVGGRTTQEIARRLRGEFGMTRNRAYELALRAAERK
ncbi:MAG: 16S rRNA (cytidine(1402)-2'-O)-methyltransferase [Candidatus Palauibacterales bacterium]|nr:16S rRNA (cytidine(1402)-2'-O)-methyltransferase [Candidatus Palauibacterales bacterium]MDP2482871.1 16S rRNA (cytidine(1402)-2'-O)-methyltransferase [Candidatus Palauibacterales bacterium]